MMAIVHWGNAHMVDSRGRPLLHEHKSCKKMFDPVMVCSECGEPLLPKEVHIHPGPGARKVAAAPKDEKPIRRKPDKSGLVPMQRSQSGSPRCFRSVKKSACCNSIGSLPTLILSKRPLCTAVQLVWATH